MSWCSPGKLQSLWPSQTSARHKRRQLWAGSLSTFHESPAPRSARRCDCNMPSWWRQPGHRWANQTRTRGVGILCRHTAPDSRTSGGHVLCASVWVWRTPALTSTNTAQTVEHQRRIHHRIIAYSLTIEFWTITRSYCEPIKCSIVFKRDRCAVVAQFTYLNKCTVQIQ